MPSYTPGLTYIAAVFDALLLKLRLGDETTDASIVGVSVGSPEGQVVGSPGDIRIAIPGEVGATVGLWQKETGELTETGWVEISGLSGALAGHFVVYQAGDVNLTNARVITAGTNVTIDLTTPGQVIVNAVAGGGGTTLQTAITNQGAVPTTQAFSTRIQIGNTSSWQFEDQAGNDVVVIAGDNSATAFSVQGGNTAAGAGQAISLLAGNATVAGQNGGTITETAGAGNGAGAGGSILLSAGPGGASGPGGSAVLRGGAGGSVSGNAGSATVAGGIPVDGNGGGATLAASSGVGTNRDGGDTLVIAGNATGNATGGSTAIGAGGGGATGIAGPLAITGGAAGSVSGDSGSITLSTQPSVAGDTGSITHTTGNATGGAAGNHVFRGGTGTPNGRVLVQPIWSGDGQAIAIVGNGASSSTAGLHAGSRDPNGAVSSNPGSIYLRNATTSGAAYINTSGVDPGVVWSQIATTDLVTLQRAITNQSTTPTTQNFDTTIGLTGGAAWLFVDNTASALVTIDDGAVIGVSITGRQVTATGAGQDVNVAGGAATGLNQAGGDVILAGGPGNGSGLPGMARISSAWALDATISPAALGAGNTNNYAPTNGTTTNTWRLTPNAAGSTITGITGGQAGRKLELFNLSTTNPIVLTHDDTGNSTAANCFLLPGSASLTIPPLGSVVIWYDTTSSRWRTDAASFGTVTLQAAINGQGTTPTSQTIDTTIGLTSGAAWTFVDHTASALVTIDDGAATGVAITGHQVTATGAGQSIRIGGGSASAASGQDGGDITLAAGAGDGAGLAGMVLVSSSWALDATISPAALSGGNNNNYAPTNGTTSNTWRLTPNAATSTITGITGGQAGRKLELFNLSTTVAIILTNDDTGNSTAANCFLLPNGASLTIPPLGSVVIWYDTTSSRWRTDASSFGNITLQAAINGQGTTPTSQTTDTTIGLTSGAAWTFVNNAALALITVEDDATIGVNITGQDTAGGAGQDVNIAGGAATSGNQDGGDVILAGNSPSGTGNFGMVRVNSAWALDSTISPAALGAGNNNNYAPTSGAQSNTWRLTPNAAGSTITGITAGQAGRKIEIFNISTTASITLTHNDTGNSTAANCFFLPNAASVVIPPLASVVLWYDTTSSRWRIDGAAGASIAPGTTQIQDFTNTAGGTFDAAAAIAAGYTTVHVIVIGGGGGGGGGGSTTTPGGGSIPGGRGGGGGARCEGVFRLSELTSSVAITVATGGTGGAGGSNAAGSNGNVGGNSSFGAYLVAGGGGGGFGSAASLGGSGGAGGGLGSAGAVGVSGSNVQGGGGPGVASITNPVQGSASGGKGGGSLNDTASPGGSAEWGGAGGGAGLNASSAAGGSSWWGGAGGGVGGGHTSGGVAITGTAGGVQRSITAGGGGSAGTTGAVPTAGSNGTNGDFTNPGTAGGGGGGVSAGVSNLPGQAGGNGGLYGNGGGGGGATAGNGAGAPQTGGAGGNGAQGAVRVILS